MTATARRPARLPTAERELMANVIELAQWLGYRAYHPWLSIHSAGGYPDLTLVCPRLGRIVWIELKGERGVVSDEQQAWIRDIRAAGGDAAIFYPADWHSGAIERFLSAPALTSEEARGLSVKIYR